MSSWVQTVLGLKRLKLGQSRNIHLSRVAQFLIGHFCHFQMMLRLLVCFCFLSLCRLTSWHRWVSFWQQVEFERCHLISQPLESWWVCCCDHHPGIARVFSIMLQVLQYASLIFYLYLALLWPQALCAQDSLTLNRAVVANLSFAPLTCCSVALLRMPACGWIPSTLSKRNLRASIFWPVE